MGLLLGSAGAHTYPESGQVAPTPAPLIEGITKGKGQFSPCHTSLLFFTDV